MFDYKLGMKWGVVSVRVACDFLQCALRNMKMTGVNPQ